MKKLYVFLALFIFSLFTPGCEPHYYTISGIGISMAKEVTHEYDGLTYYNYGPADSFDTRIAFIVKKEHEHVGNTCAQTLGSLSLIDRCYAFQVEEKECGSLAYDTFELYFLAPMTHGNRELGADDNLLAALKERFTIKQSGSPIFDPIVLYSDEALLGEMTFGEDTFTAVFKCRTTRGAEFEARTTVKIGTSED